MMEDIRKLAQEQEQYVLALRRHFHRNPEPSWEEVDTTKKVAEELRAIGCENIKVGFGGTECGVTAEITGTLPASVERCVALRADLDALSMNDEKEGVEYRSQRPGMAHTCGHDGHAAMLLGAAKVLMKIKDRICGKVRLIFQPSEENVMRSGAKQMISDGVLNGVDGIFGFHLFSAMPTGTVNYAHGPFMAASDRFEVVISGKGGHGSMPHLAIDPTVAMAAAITSWQTIVSRETAPLDAKVISVGAIETSSQVSNVIPDRVKMTGTIRGFSVDVMKTIEEAFKRTTANIAAAYRCEAEITYVKGYPPTINDSEMLDIAKSAATELLDDSKVNEIPPLTGSEDFSYYQLEIPGAYFGLGVACKEKGTDYPHHSPKFDIDESMLTTGVALHVLCALRFLENPA